MFEAMTLEPFARVADYRQQDERHLTNRDFGMKPLQMNSKSNCKRTNSDSETKENVRT
jgi:hypothetical protein